jgi:hypothetical protein
MHPNLLHLQEVVAARCLSILSFSTILSTRPDIAFSVSVVSRYTSTPDDLYLKALKDIYRYLRSTTNYELYFQGTLKSLTGYTDALLGDDTSTRQSTSGYTFNLSSGAIIWSSKR